MSVWKLRVHVRGGHVHCDLFVAEHSNHTYANCGSFVVGRGEEFRSLQHVFGGAIYTGAVDEARTEASND